MAQLKFNPVGELTDLTKVRDQLAAAEGINRETRQRSQVWSKMADTVQEAHDATEGVYADVAGLIPDGYAEVMRKVAEALNPQASLLWTKEQLDVMVSGVEFFLARGAYEGEQETEARTVLDDVERLRNPRKGGDRAPKTEAQLIEGRPARVRITTTPAEDGTKEIISRGQAANTENSVSNITGSLRAYLKDNGLEVSTEMAEEIRQAVKRAVEENETPVQVGDFAILEHLTD